MGRYLITRAEPGASETAARLVALGHEAILAPALTIEPVNASAALDGVAALLFTSANGVRAFAAASARRDLPAYCVGDATAEAARESGFAQIVSAAGNVVSLADRVRTHRAPKDGRLLHAAGENLAGDLAGHLRAHGFDVETRPYYRAVVSTALPHELRDTSPRIDGVLFHSARAATALTDAAIREKAQESFTRITAFCMSDAVADSARRVTWKQVLVSTEPHEAALLALLSGKPHD